MTDTAHDFSDFPVPNTNLTGNDKTEARMLAVQAIYQSQLLDDKSSDEILREFIVHFIDAQKANKEIFSIIMQTARDEKGRFVELISNHIDSHWSWERLGLVEQSLLLAAVAEMNGRPETAAPIILNEFMNISKGFIGEKESKFINGILNAIAHKMRPTEFEK